jgi:NitT/TauT family transport system ATP-binding protein
MTLNNSETYLIRLDGVSQSYPQKDGSRRLILNDIRLRIRSHEFVSVVGPSGCGKSTLLRLILGSELPTAGDVMFEGDRIAGVGRDRGIVFQRYSLFPHLSVIDNISFGPLLEQLTMFDRLCFTPKFYRARRWHREEARELVERVGLRLEDGEKFPHELSGGMQQRVAIAQALIMRPKVLLMDEPFGALDHTTREAMQLFILEMRERFRITVLFVTHDLEEAAFLGTRILALSQYWSDGSGQAVGARIVNDRKIAGGYPKPTGWKYSKEFNELLLKIRRDALDPEHRQHLSQFDHDHQDAWHPTRGWLDEASAIND